MHLMNNYTGAMPQLPKTGGSGQHYVLLCIQIADISIHVINDQ